MNGATSIREQIAEFDQHKRNHSMQLNQLDRMGSNEGETGKQGDIFSVKETLQSETSICLHFCLVLPD
jgi:hypothetical protein